MVWKENRENAYCEITPAILALKEQWEKKNYIDPKLYKEYNVKRGLRDEDGRGVLTGLTRVGEIQSYSVTEGEHIIPQDGMLYYRGIDCRELVKCDRITFTDVKAVLEEWALNRALDPRATAGEKAFAVMVETGLRPEALSEETIRQTLEKARRRRTYVPARRK